MNRIKKVVMIVVLISLVATQCSAITTIEENTSIFVEEELEVPYHYLNEQKLTYKIRSYNGNQIYALGKYSDSLNETVTNGIQYKDTEMNHILENAYPIREYIDLGCANWKEAYLATQEAIYCTLLNRNVNDYIAENEIGQRIINAVKKILKTPKEEEITIEEVTNWISLSNTEKYKEYNIKCRHELCNYKVKAGGENIKITDTNGNRLEMAQRGERFRVVIPKYMQDPISIEIEAEIIGTYVQICHSKVNSNGQYVMPEIGNLQVKKSFPLNISDAKVLIQNKDQKDENLAGSCFDILDSQYQKIKENVQTDRFGKITFYLDNGKYYLKQTSTASGYEVNKALLEIDIQNGKDVNINIVNTKKIYETTTTTQKEINVTEETKEIQETNTKEVSNIHTTNINKEIINQINETNLHNVNHFINTISRKNVVNLKKENQYKNWIDEINVESRNLVGENRNLNMTRSDYINQMDLLMHGKINVPILPVASK